MPRVIGFEISSQDPQRAVAFYRAVFGWEFAEAKWDYWSVTIKAGPIKDGLQGGISKGPHDYPHGTRIQIEVESIDETILKAKEYGALVVREKMEFDEFYLAYLVDPTGVGFGLVQPK